MMRLEQRNSKRCLCCRSHVTPDFRRTFGDSNDVVHRCANCDTYERLSRGSATGKDVAKPDPIDEPERFNCGIDVPRPVDSVVATDGGDSR